MLTIVLFFVELGALPKLSRRRPNLPSSFILWHRVSPEFHQGQPFFLPSHSTKPRRAFSLLPLMETHSRWPWLLTSLLPATPLQHSPILDPRSVQTVPCRGDFLCRQPAVSDEGRVGCCSQGCQPAREGEDCRPPHEFCRLARGSIQRKQPTDTEQYNDNDSNLDQTRIGALTNELNRPAFVRDAGFRRSGLGLSNGVENGYFGGGSDTVKYPAIFNGF